MSSAPKNEGAAALGKLGGKARMRGLSAGARRELARKAGLASAKARAAMRKHGASALVTWSEAPPVRISTDSNQTVS
jgi:hypothetical protein